MLSSADFLEQVLFELHLEFGVQRHGRERRVLVDERVGVRHLAVVAARRGEREPPDAEVDRAAYQMARGVPVDSRRDVGLAFASRIADDRSEVDDCVVLLRREHLVESGVVADVDLVEREPWMAPQVEDRLAAESELVYAHDSVAFFEQRSQNAGPDIAGTARDHHSLHLDHVLPFPCESVHVASARPESRRRPRLRRVAASSRTTRSWSCSVRSALIGRLNTRADARSLSPRSSLPR